MSTLEKTREDLLAYGLRLGIVTPLLHRCCDQIAELQAVQKLLRDGKNYAEADRLRLAVVEIQQAADYAFPGLYG